MLSCNCRLLRICFFYRSQSPWLGGCPSPRLPCGAGEAVALLILVCPVWGWDRLGMCQVGPPAPFLCKEVGSQREEKGALIRLVCYGAAGACVGTRDKLNPSRTNGPPPASSPAVGVSPSPP